VEWNQSTVFAKALFFWSFPANIYFELLAIFIMVNYVLFFGFLPHWIVFLAFMLQYFIISQNARKLRPSHFGEVGSTGVCTQHLMLARHSTI
jgi:Ca2+/Na+ antiporter